MYLDFAYIIGTSAQTADVSFTSQKIRQLGTVHCVLAFFYNVAVLSLMINLASGLIGNWWFFKYAPTYPNNDDRN